MGSAMSSVEWLKRSKRTKCLSSMARVAKLLCGGLGRPTGLDSGFFTQPTIFSEMTSDMRIAREEIFGPVLSIMPY